MGKTAAANIRIPKISLSIAIPSISNSQFIYLFANALRRRPLRSVPFYQAMCEPTVGQPPRAEPSSRHPVILIQEIAYQLVPACWIFQPVDLLRRACVPPDALRAAHIR